VCVFSLSVYVCVRVCMYVWGGVHLCLPACVRAQVFVIACMQVRMRASKWVCTHACMLIGCMSWTIVQAIYHSTLRLQYAEVRYKLCKSRERHWGWWSWHRAWYSSPPFTITWVDVTKPGSCFRHAISKGSVTLCQPLYFRTCSYFTIDFRVCTFRSQVSKERHKWRVGNGGGIIVGSVWN